MLGSNANYVRKTCRQARPLPSFSKSLLTVFLGTVTMFMVVFAIYLGLNRPSLADNGYDAFRFLYAALTAELAEIEDLNEFLLIRIIRVSIVGGLPLYTGALFFLSILFLNRIVVANNGRPPKISYLLAFTPILIVYLETGKDIMIVTAMIVLYGILRFRRELFSAHNFLVNIFIVTTFIFVMLFAFLIKGVTILIYFSLVVFMASPVNRNAKIIFSLALLLLSFFLGYEIRGPVNYAVVAPQTAFSSPLLISFGDRLQAILAGTFRSIVYFSAPLWYWIIALSNLPSSPGLVFHAWGYLVMAYMVLRYRFWKNINYLLGALVFSFSYPFVHLRYFFTFVIFWLLVKLMVDPRWFKSTDFYRLKLESRRMLTQLSFAKYRP